MNRATIERICGLVAEATARVREVFRGEMEMLEILDRFWCLQDQLSRLLDSAYENPGEFLNTQEREYPSLILDVFDVMHLAAKGRSAQADAVKQSCESINDLLTEIANLRAPSAAAARVFTADSVVFVRQRAQPW